MSTATAPLTSLRTAARWYRDAPAPAWNGPEGSRSRLTGWVAANMVAWTAVGLAATVAFVEVLQAVATRIG